MPEPSQQPPQPQPQPQPSSVENSESNANNSTTSNPRRQRRRRQRQRDGRSNQTGRGGRGGRTATTATQQQQQQQQRHNRTNDEEESTSTSILPPSQIIRSTTQTKQKKKKNSNTTDTTSTNNSTTTNNTIKKKKKKKKKNQQSKKYWWRSHIPSGTVDPISLDPLHRLTYPPFALKITPPYDPIPQWPILETNKEEIPKNEETVKALRQSQFLQEQWGSTIAPPPVTKTEEQDKDTTTKDKEEEQEEIVHLFDGKVLAYYLVSQLQFIDPLNRRDLTRDELLNLDQYLIQNNLGNKKKAHYVVEAYDAKGTIHNRAGAVYGQSENGRAQLLQQEARVLLNAIFESSTTTRGTATNQLARQYEASQMNTTTNNHRTTTTTTQANDFYYNEDEGIYYNEDGGMVIIDDDVNPGLRGGMTTALNPNAVEFQNASTAGNRYYSNAASTTAATATATATTVSTTNESLNENSLWTSRNILSRHSHAARVTAANFPSLSSLAITTTTTDNSNNNNNSTTTINTTQRTTTTNTKSKSLCKISNMVQKVPPKQLKKQRKAREKALQKAGLMISTTSTDNDLTTTTVLDNTTTTIPQSSQQYRKTGWARPTSPPPPLTLSNSTTATATATATTGKPNDIRALFFASNDTTATATATDPRKLVYPDALIIKARELLTFVLKLEKKWITFCKDDTAASCPLHRMAKPMRAFVHEYSDYWNFHTESFDLEPNRYIHVVKLNDTRAPYPLLSQAVRTWIGPTTNASSNTTSTMAAGQTTMSTTRPREVHLQQERVPLKLEPRSNVLPVGIMVPGGAMFESQDQNETTATTTYNDEPIMSMKDSKGFALTLTPQEPAPRFAPLLAEQEGRKKLQLEKRTIPLELPPSTTTTTLGKMKQSLQANRQYQQEQTKVKEEMKQTILAAAFASDEEDNSIFSDDSDWEVAVPLYKATGEEEE